MEKLLKSHKVRLLILATAISLLAGVFTIKEGNVEHVLYFDFLVLSLRCIGIFPNFLLVWELIHCSS
ncbi:MAG: hypothetical protein ABGU93_13235 [Acetobacterium sp.]|uniref:hypothetical protein n=1 Tax=Acetobacterium sp. TaxID=1872094 RepID=UPI00324218E9